MSISISETNKRQDTDQIVDVREHFEITEGMIPTALHIPMGEITERVTELDKQHLVIVVCRSGRRSTEVAAVLKNMGFEAYSMDGGMNEWYRNNLPIK
ncbi:hypothetical protein CDES_00265 [Corynebacterium deserti GIMN1.010]|uniref:Rhodanese domain-containing protein n=1 Tax=Corynebacterium deserti GIMN1.010 TaxID=931089 RepID=A0A0M3Q8U3_9CORY|nr:rhodanese-like domain-containing protein [Corynebacterium deserti]ALC04539.1 hypothetical protein CDES_00265 [Corynebacterium deserti GIMN1.010]